MWQSKLSEGARVDFDEAADWYREHDPKVAQEFVLSLDRMLKSIKTDPERFATIASGVYAANLRDFPYQIIYRLYNRIVDVVAIAHHSRRSGYWNSRLGEWHCLRFPDERWL